MSRLLLPDTSWSAADRARPRTSIAEVQALVTAYRQRERALRHARRRRHDRQAEAAARRARRQVTRAEARVADWHEVRRVQRRHRIDTREKGLELSL